MSQAVGKTLYVGDLPRDTTEDDLRQLFGRFGAVRGVRIEIDLEPVLPRASAVVEMAGGADEAVAALNGTDFRGRFLTFS